MSEFNKFTPVVSKKILMLISGIMWLCVGLMLLNYAYSWLVVEQQSTIITFAGAGIALTMLTHHFGFLKVADKNLNRILLMEEKVSIFSFITWKSYILVIFMIAMGITLRTSPIPKPWLAILYIGIGMGLFLSSIRYLRFFITEIIKKHKE